MSTHMNAAEDFPRPIGCDEAQALREHRTAEMAVVDEEGPTWHVVALHSPPSAEPTVLVPASELSRAKEIVDEINMAYPGEIYYLYTQLRALMDSWGAVA